MQLDCILLQPTKDDLIRLPWLRHDGTNSREGGGSPKLRNGSPQSDAITLPGMIGTPLHYLDIFSKKYEDSLVFK